jgi:hypothetical protein
MARRRSLRIYVRPFDVLNLLNAHFDSFLASFYPKRDDTLHIYADVEDAVANKPIRRYTYPMGHNLEEYVTSRRGSEFYSH